MKAADLRTLVDYSYWANARLLDGVALLTNEQYTKPLESSFSSARDTMVHIYGAESIWTVRMHGESPAGFPSVDSLPDVATLRAGWTTLESRLRNFVASLDDAGAGRVVEFKNIAGDSFTTPVWQIVQHMVNHATYHRGQVTTMVRQLGAPPPKSMDLIFYYSELAKPTA